MVRQHEYVVDELIPVDHQGRRRCAACKLPPDNRCHRVVRDNTVERYEVDRAERGDN